MTTNHSRGIFVDPNNTNNSINALENENRHFKASLINRRTDKLLSQYMSVFTYRRRRLDRLATLGEKIYQFLKDIALVYPGRKNGMIVPGLEFKEMIIPTVESEELSEFMPPPAKRLKPHASFSQDSCEKAGL